MEMRYPDGRPYQPVPRTNQVETDQGGKTNKYHNCKIIVQGIQFDSRKEANRYEQLLLMERASLIRHIEIHPRYDLVVNDQYIGFYRADFCYEETENNTIVVEDVKSPATKTAVYRLKKKLVKALYDIEIIEV